MLATVHVTFPDINSMASDDWWWKSQKKPSPTKVCHPWYPRLGQNWTSPLRIKIL